MPRNGQGVYSLPPNTAAVAGQTIESAPYNTVNNDIANDLNAARPITAGGTGATNAADALANLGGVGQTNFLEAFAIGDFYGTVRDISAEGGVWLRRDGDLYNVADYPDLAALLPALSDGVLWRTRVSGTTLTVQDIIHDGTRFVAVANNLVLSSSTGETWVVLSSLPSAAAGYGIAYGAGVYVIADLAEGKAYVSPNAETWSATGVLNASGVIDVDYSTALSLFIMVGSGGYISTSPDGTSYTTRTSGTTQILNRVRVFGSNIIAVGGNGVINTSTNATAWTLRTSGVSAFLHDVSFDGTQYVVVGTSGTVVSSTNLTGWTVRTPGTTSTLNVSLSSSAGYLVAGENGVARISSNLTTWSAAPTGITGTLKAGIVDPNNAARYLIGGPSQTVLDGLRTLPTQFRVPDDDEDYGWIKAEDA